MSNDGPISGLVVAGVKTMDGVVAIGVRVGLETSLGSVVGSPVAGSFTGVSNGT
jgi:hypothetical protein